MKENKFYIKALLAVMAIYLPLAGCACKNKFLFYPYKPVVATPLDLGLAYEDADFTTEDGIRLNGWWVPKRGARGTLLFCHGNGGNISFLLDTVRIFHSLNLNVLVFDYRGYGKSGGSPTEEGTYRDALAAWNYLLANKKIAPDRIVLAGRSLGGPIAAWLARECRPRMLILESTFTKAADVAVHHYWMAPAETIFGDTYNTGGYMDRVTCPVLVVHSPDDKTIPYALGRRLYELARPPKEFLVIRGSHNSGFVESAEGYRTGLSRFIDKYF